MTADNFLTEAEAFKALSNFFREKPLIFFGTGMSCALDARFGMEALKEELSQQLSKIQLVGAAKEQWEYVRISLQNGDGLESAMSGAVDQELVNIITKATGNYVASIDREYAYRTAQGEIEWPAIKLVKRIVDTLPEGDRILHVVTPNYDMLFEYACEKNGVLYTNGFTGGVERRLDWDSVDLSMRTPEHVLQRRKMRMIYKHKKHVRIYKVHGSLNYFFHRGSVVENGSWMWSPPDFTQRVIITPGISKYETIQQFRMELLSKADSVISKENHFLFLGYGFNDKHLEEYIKRKLVSQGCFGLIITRDFNEHIRDLLSQADNLWLVCGSEGSCNGSRIFNKKYSNWLNIPDKKLWDMAEFTSNIIGG